MTNDDIVTSAINEMKQLSESDASEEEILAVEQKMLQDVANNQGN